MSDENVCMGIAWYDPDDYERIRAMCVDCDELQDTYEEWLEDAQRVFDMASARGYLVERVPVRPAHFSAWCRIKGLPMNSRSRSQYAEEFARWKHEDKE
jgi:hypothetical protein